ncbi:MAG: lycopene cyclase domain-containing protein [Bacteroidetes bacterium]|nr:lycopene cyclase domain-containing protein [Bacteroidota bacterium]
MSAYAWIILCSFVGPLILSFDKKVAFYKHWKSVSVAILIVALPFIFSDELFTQWGVWGFTENYLLGIYFGNLPLEEVLFFVVVPYNCVFIFEVLMAYFKNVSVKKLSKAFYFIFAGVSLGNLLLNVENQYTFYASLVAFVCAFCAFLSKAYWLQYFMLTYVVSLIPFFIVNGILTGAVTEAPMVWYNENDIIGWRILTIPYEDFFYNFDLIFLNIFIHQFLRYKPVLNEVEFSN